MADRELRFIGALLTAPPQEQERFYTQAVPLSVFKHRAKEMLWLRNYRAKHGHYPSRIALQNQIQEPVPKHKDSLEVCLQPILDMAMYQDMRQVNERVKQMLDQKQPIQVAMQAMKDGAARLNSFSTEYVDCDVGQSRAAMTRYLEYVRRLNNPDSLLLDSPWKALNKLIGTFRPGNLVTLASRTSIGKTWLLAYWAHHYASRGIKTVFITKEMTTDEIEDRTEALRFKFPYDLFRLGQLNGKQIRQWKTQRSKAQSPYPLIICGEETVAGTGFDHIVAKLDQYRPQVLFIDGAYLIKPVGVNRSASRTEVLGHISNQSKSIAKARKVLLIESIQLNRAAEDKKGNTKGGLVNVFGSDTWAQDSDYLLTMGGKRGSNMRSLALDKGRESNLGEFFVDFQLNPYPEFKDGFAAKTIESGSTVSFKRMK